MGDSSAGCPMTVQAALQSLTLPGRVRERVPPVVWGEPSFNVLMSFSTKAMASCASLMRLCACATWRCALRPSAWQWDLGSCPLLHAS